MSRTAVVVAVVAAAYLVWPAIGPDTADRWVVKSTENYKGHPTWEGRDLVECEIDGVDASPTRLIKYANWRELEQGDVCPEGDR